MYYIICTSRIIRTFNRRKLRKRNDTPRFDVSNYKLEWENSQRFEHDTNQRQPSISRRYSKKCFSVPWTSSVKSKQM